MQNNLRRFRQVHRKIAPIVFLPLLATAISGVVYGVGRSWFGGSRSIASMMTIHTGEFLGDPLVPVYVTIVGLSLVAMIATGLMLLRSRWGNQPLTGRTIHRWLTPILVLPLTISAVTGVAYELGQDWLGLAPRQVAFLLRLHQGSYFGSGGRVVYMLLVGAGLIILLVTGINMTGIARQWRRQR